MKYLLKDTTNNTIISMWETPIVPSPPLVVVEVSDADFEFDMLNSIFTDVKNYKVHPGLGTTDDWWESNGRKWIDTRPDDLVWEHVREKRNGELLHSDWTQLDDAGLSPQDKGLWTAYRNALRNVPDVSNNPRNVESALKRIISDDKPVTGRSA
jgi:hypothetical protein